MEILTMKWHRQHRTLEFYCLNQHYLIDRLADDHVTTLEGYLKKLPLAMYMLIPLNEAYIECYRSQRPYIQLVIDPNELMRHAKGLMEEDAWAYRNEVAATITEENYDQWDLIGFLEKFSSAQTLQEAQQIYHTWQEYLTGDTYESTNLMELIEFYYEEIFLYFRLKPYLQQLIKRGATIR